MHKYTIGEIMDIACRAGKIILENGGEIYRVEDTMLYVCKAFGISDCECYATPTTIIISVIDAHGEVFSRMMRIRERGVNLLKVEAVNNFSRKILQEPITVAEAKQKLREIENIPTYNLPTIVLAVALGTASFAIILGGNWLHFICGFVTGALLRLVIIYLNRIQLGFFTVNLFGGVGAALGGWLLMHLGILPEWRVITLSTVMQLVPGLIFTNALRDAAAGDLVSAISRGTEAFSIVTALACGAGATLMVLGWLGGM